MSYHFFYNIDYDEEADDYEVDKQGNVQLMNGKITDWETVKRNGYDAFIFLLQERGWYVISICTRRISIA
ncbi:hypothetical protein OL548_25455 [Lysinibacillus sp. MHQ-1]|nr:hypothetical protein OL548_25455 [Lysinibacillus sp. MHQ-1]